MIARRVIFQGRVQGVGFRYTVKELAHGFDVCGWIKNLPEGSVEMHVMGELTEIDSFVEEITHQSSVARNIKNHIIESIPLLDNCRGFHIKS